MKKPIGKMDARITIQRATVTTDDQGSVTETWADLATVWAHALTDEIRATEESTEGTRQASADTTFTIRYQLALSDLGTKDRISFKGVNHDILSAVPAPDTRPDSIVIRARRISA